MKDDLIFLDKLHATNEVRNLLKETLKKGACLLLLRMHCLHFMIFLQCMGSISERRTRSSLLLRRLSTEQGKPRDAAQ